MNITSMDVVREYGGHVDPKLVLCIAKALAALRQRVEQAEAERDVLKANLTGGISQVEELTAECDRLREVVDKLPVTADGVVITFDSEAVWHPEETRDVMAHKDLHINHAALGNYFRNDAGEWMALDDHYDSVGGLDHYARKVSECYSTKELAIATLSPKAGGLDSAAPASTG